MKDEERKIYGGFLIVPLKYDDGGLNTDVLENVGSPITPITMDLNENVKAMLNHTGSASVGRGYICPAGRLCSVLGENITYFTVADEKVSYDFLLNDSYIYVFNTRVAFLCLSLSFDRMEALKTIINPGWAFNPAKFFFHSGEETIGFSMENWLADILAPMGLRKFFDGDSSYLLDYYVYNFALVPEWFDELEPMKKLTFNLHKMLSLDVTLEDEAEEDVRFVYAAKNQDMKAYRWGCCVTSQTISYVVADDKMDLDAQMDIQAADGLPVVMLALYEKYTCLRFTELITDIHRKELKRLKELMLNFRAFGTVTPANLSRWHNVKQIYAGLLDVNDIPTAIEDISVKLSIIADRQEAIDHARSETVVNLVTVFGIVSIMASVLTIVQILASGSALVWISTILTAAMLVLVVTLALLRR